MRDAETKARRNQTRVVCNKMPEIKGNPYVLGRIPDPTSMTLLYLALGSYPQVGPKIAPGLSVAWIGSSAQRLAGRKTTLSSEC